MRAGKVLMNRASRIRLRVGVAVVSAGIGFASTASAQLPAEKTPSRAAVEAEPAPKTILQPGEYPIDLESALRLAGAENPELLRARERVLEATAIRQLAAAQLLPNLNLGTNYDLHRGFAAAKPNSPNSCV